MPTSEHVAEIVGRQGKRASGHREGWSGGLPSPALKVHRFPLCPPLALSLPDKGGPAPCPDSKCHKVPWYPSSGRLSGPFLPWGSARRQRNILELGEERGGGAASQSPGPCGGGVGSGLEGLTECAITWKCLLWYLLVDWGGGTPGTFCGWSWGL